MLAAPKTLEVWTCFPCWWPRSHQGTSAILCPAAQHKNLKHLRVAPRMFLTLTVSYQVATGLAVIASDNNTEYKCQDALGQPTEENQCSSHLFCSSESCSVSSFLLSSSPASSLRFTPKITFRILRSARQLMKTSSTNSSEDNLWIEETLIWGHRRAALAVPLMQMIDCFWQCCLGCAVS